MYLHVSVYTVSTDAGGGQKPQGSSELELDTLVSRLNQVLGTEPGSLEEQTVS